MPLVQATGPLPPTPPSPRDRCVAALPLGECSPLKALSLMAGPNRFPGTGATFEVGEKFPRALEGLVSALRTGGTAWGLLVTSVSTNNLDACRLGHICNLLGCVWSRSRQEDAARSNSVPKHTNEKSSFKQWTKLLPNLVRNFSDSLLTMDGILTVNMLYQMCFLKQVSLIKEEPFDTIGSCSGLQTTLPCYSLWLMVLCYI
ncbi:uncharacterized protein LOC141566241 isoform X2 [Sminthopsis crassicaudata]|uniref:uncharacterized protein LOC141566241 isoform X2 n=1 Tax=Sminthopsis crassicaudata TaxID=9301 RepID=UPI003D690743